MAKFNPNAARAQAPVEPAGSESSVPWVALAALLAGLAGFLLPRWLPQALRAAPDALSGLAVPAGRQAPPVLAVTGGQREPWLIPFGEIVVNLAEERLTRHLTVNFTLLVEASDAALVAQQVEAKKTILKNWIISYLSDKSLDEVRGAAGVNQARRDIREQCNRLLFPDGSQRIQDVLFEEFTVQ